MEDGSAVLIGTTTENPSFELKVVVADCNGRHLLNMCEILPVRDWEEPLDTTGLAAAVRRRAPVYYKFQDSHYNLISALHKSLRGSDTDVALY